MSDPGPAGAAITGLGVACALGRGVATLLAGVRSGVPAFGPVERFDVGRQRATAAATLAGAADLATELAAVIDDACTSAGLGAAERSATPLMVAEHADPGLVRSGQPPAARDAAVALAHRCGLGGPPRAYTNGCVAGSTALIDATMMLAAGRADRVVVAGGYLVDADYFQVFDAGRALAKDGRVRPFSADRKGMLLGDAAVAVVVEPVAAARRRGAPILARLTGWGRTGDAYHVCRPHPEGLGMARAIRAALDRAAVPAGRLGYVNAHGSGTAYSDTAETRALYGGLGERAGTVPVSSTKSVHGHTLEASALLELAGTVVALRDGHLPVNAGYLGPDPDCPLNLVLRPTSATGPRCALILNGAFGGANTALVVAWDD